MSTLSPQYDVNGYFAPVSITTHPGVLRSQGCLLGQITGDSLGSLVEFRSAESIAAQYGPEGPQKLEHGGTFGTRAGQPTDDSELALMLARSLAQERTWSLAAVADAYLYWYESRPFDIGGTTSQAMQALQDSSLANAFDKRDGFQLTPEYLDRLNAQSQANGSLMRVSPIGIAVSDPFSAAMMAYVDSALTHPHPACRWACAAYCYALSRIIHSGHISPEDVIQEVMDFLSAKSLYDLGLRAKALSCGGVAKTLVNEAITPSVQGRLMVLDWLSDVYTEGVHGGVDIGDIVTFSDQIGWVRIAFSNAFWQLADAATLKEGITDTVRRGGDTDTNGAIAGALLGAYHGVEAIPQQWRRSVRNCESRPGLPFPCVPRPVDFWPTDAEHLAHALFNLNLG